MRVIKTANDKREKGKTGRRKEKNERSRKKSFVETRTRRILEDGFLQAMYRILRTQIHGFGGKGSRANCSGNTTAHDLDTDSHLSHFKSFGSFSSLFHELFIRYVDRLLGNI